MDILDLMGTIPAAPTPAFISTQVRRGRYAFVDLQPPAAVPLSLVCAGWEECAPDYHIARHGFRYHAVEYIVSGQWHLEIVGRSLPVGPGTVFAYGPQTRYRLRSTAGRQPGKFFVDFAGREAGALLKASRLLQDGPRRILHSRWIHDIFDQLLDCANLSRTASRRIGTKLTELLLARLREDLHSTGERHSEAHRTFLRARQHVQEHYLDLRTVDEVAHRCHLAPAYLSRLFRRFTDETPLQYLTRLKMDHAAELLLQGDHSVKWTAAAVGFQDPYHFSRVFKRVHGVAPGQFRR
ncbi:MAG: helix-turn-helix transcriptional regulator [Verrucomicrobiales bacterium]|nr:helix-turn-helix transcriptional regulator [Verrucomicrobiales bacterium]